VTASEISVLQSQNSVEFTLDLVLDNAALNRIHGITTLTAGALRSEMEAAAMPSLRQVLARAGQQLGEKGLPDRQVEVEMFPPGVFKRVDTQFRVEKEPKNRISWMAGLLPYMGQQNLYSRVQFDKSWRDPSNWGAGNTLVPQFLDPSYPYHTRQIGVDGLPLDFAATHFVGIAGIGMDAASYKRGDPATMHKQGVLGYEESASLAQVRAERGLSNTILMIQVPHDGVTGVSPWIAGGGATLRGVPEKNSIAPFVLSTDKNGKIISHQNKRGTYAMMTDGSVRFIDQNVSDEVFKAMCTVKGPKPDGFDPAKDPHTPLVPPPGETKKDAKSKVEPKVEPKIEPKIEPKKETPTPPGDISAALQGEWLAKSLEADGKSEDAKDMTFEFKGNLLTFRKGKIERKGTFTIDAKASPARIDVVDPGEKGALLGILELKGNELRLNLTDPSADAVRPTDFTTRPGMRASLFVLTKKQ
jgi:uncharacterized protein (TIGR03067 family)